MSYRVLVLALALAAPWAAQDQQRSRTTSPDVGTAVQNPEIDFFDSAADYFRYSGSAVRAIYRKGTPVDEVPAVLYLSRFSKLTANQVMAARKAGKSWDAVAREAGVKYEGDNFVAFANSAFLSRYHSRPIEEVQRLRSTGATWVAINQEFRRVGSTPQSSTPTP